MSEDESVKKVERTVYGNIIKVDFKAHKGTFQEWFTLNEFEFTFPMNRFMTDIREAVPFHNLIMAISADGKCIHMRTMYDKHEMKSAYEQFQADLRSMQIRFEKDDE